MAIQESISSRTKPMRLQMSREAFLAWADEDTHAEWVDGEVFVFMPATDIHQATLGFLYHLLALFVDLFQLGQLRVAPFEMKLRAGRAYREPDILFVARENLSRLTDKRLNGPADLVIEIVSTDSVHRDRHTKFNEYAQAGIPEYWIIDPRPRRQAADFFWLNEQGEYELFATEQDEKAVSRVLPGFWLRPDWLWQADTLAPLTALLEMRGLSAEQMQQIETLLKSGNAT